MNEKIFLGIELGSTRIKAAGIDGSFRTVLSGDYTWKSDLVDGVWTYPMEKVWEGLRQATAPFSGSRLGALGVSAMMHGYLAFDEDWRLLTPFRTWQNTMTARAAAELSEHFDFNIPQRWSIAHLYQAILNREEHVPQIAHITTLAGYVHFRLTGVNAVGIGEGSGIFPVDSAAKDYDAGMLADFDRLSAAHGFTRPVRELLPDILLAGESAGEGGAYGMALLACYSAVKKSGETLESFLAERVFASVRSVKIAPDKAITESFDGYMTAFRALLGVERLAASVYEK